MAWQPWKVFSKKEEEKKKKSGPDVSPVPPMTLTLNYQGNKTHATLLG
jgi:hypothetical protein